MDEHDASALTPQELWDNYRPTPLFELPMLAKQTGVGRVFVKAEGERPLGNFKALGGMVAGIRVLARASGVAPLEFLAGRSERKRLPTLLCASEGNHGLAVAAAARRGWSSATVYLPSGASKTRAERIEAMGGKVLWVSGTYDDSVIAAANAAANGDGLLVPDTSANPSDPVVQDVLDGYALLTRELVVQFANHGLAGPSHVFVQAGVGGLAAALALGLQNIMQEPHALVVVEPRSAACVAHALTLGRPERISGDLRTCAEMLSCGLASAPAVEILLKFSPKSVLVTEEELKAAPATLLKVGGPATTPSGAAGLAGFLQATRSADSRVVQLDSRSVVLMVATEGSLDSESD
jgi:diaminopropionate ammonia-lyase